MSHVAKCDILVDHDLTDLRAVLAPGNRFGLELMEGQKTWNFWGESYADWEDPARAAHLNGFDPKDNGKGEHAIRQINNKPGKKVGEGGYEIGLVKRRDGKPGYEMIYDAFCGGRGLEALAGVGIVDLKKALAEQVATRALRRQGLRVVRTVTANGTVRLAGVK